MPPNKVSLLIKLRRLLFGPETDRVVGRVANWAAILTYWPALITAVAALTGVARRIISHVNLSAYFDFSVLWIERFVAAYEAVVHPFVEWLSRIVGWHLSDTQKNIVVLYFLIGGAVANTFLKATRGPHADSDKDELSLYTVFEWCGSRRILRLILLVVAPLLWPFIFPFFLLTPLLIKSSEDDPERRGGYFTQAVGTALDPTDRVVLDFRWYFARRLFWVIFLTLIICAAAAVARASAL